MGTRAERGDVEVADPARAELRKSTRAAHERLEATLRVMSPDLTLAKYASELRRLLVGHLAVERRIEPHAAALDRLGFDWEGRRKVPLLLRDLEALGETSSGPCESSERTPQTRLEVGDTFPTAAHAIGALYVVEGSTLGGVVICRHVARVLRIGGEDGASFFQGYGASTGARWKEFCAALERALVERSAQAAAVAAANATFGTFLTYATAPAPEPTGGLSRRTPQVG